MTNLTPKQQEYLDLVKKIEKLSTEDDIPFKYFDVESKEAKQICDYMDKVRDAKKRIIIDYIPFRYRNVESKEAEFWFGHRSYYIFGAVGCGKTRLAYAMFKKNLEEQHEDIYFEILGEMSDKGSVNYFLFGQKNNIFPSVKIYNFPKMLQQIRKSFGDNNNHNGNWIDDRLTVDDVSEWRGTIIIDDIGVEKSTDWMLETLYSIVNERYEKNLPTVFISNLSLKELADKVGDRIASRIAEMCTIKKIKGEDRRLKKYGPKN